MGKKQRSSSLSGGVENERTLLPEDLIVFEILVKLAVKPLFRFKSVSKRYNAIVSDPKWSHKYMQRVHSHRKPRLSSGLRSSLMYPFTNQTNLKDMTISMDSTDGKKQQLTYISSISLPRNETHKILASTNGLILTLFLHHPHSNGSLFSLCVSNPLTRQSVELPDPGNVLSKQSLTDYSVNWLFGIVSRRVEEASSSFIYKVVLIRKVPTEDWIDDRRYAKTSTYIFSSDTGSWAGWEQVTCPTDVFATGQASFSHKAVLHWQGYARSDALITYDPFNSPDRFEQIPLPSAKRTIYQRLLPDGSVYVTGCHSILYLGAKYGILFCHFTRRDEQLPCSHTLDMWRLDGGYGKGEYSWTRIRGRRSVIPSMPHLCEKLLVAPNPYEHYGFCHPFVLDNKLTVFKYKPHQVTRKVVDMVLETPQGFVAGGYRNPLIPIDFCPWSSPSFYIPT